MAIICCPKCREGWDWDADYLAAVIKLTCYYCSTTFSNPKAKISYESEK